MGCAMNSAKRGVTMNLLHQYDQFRAQFSSLCDALEKCLPTGNDFKIEIAEKGEISIALEITHRPYLMVFGLWMNEGNALGKATIQRALPQGNAKELFAIHFDTLGNVRVPPGEHHLPWPINSREFIEWLAIEVLDKFFKDLASPDYPMPRIS